MDLSKMSTEELEAIASPKASQDISSMSDEELHKIANSQAPAQESKSSETPVADVINAAGGGLATGLVKAGSALGGLATDVVGAVSPTAKEGLRAAGRAVGEVLTPGPNSIPGQAMQEHPITAKAGEITGQIAPYAVPGVGASKAANYLFSGLGGAAQADDGLLNRALGAGTGLAVQGALNVVGSAIQSGVSALRGSNIVSKVGNYVKEEANKLNQTLQGSFREVGAKSAANVYNLTRQVDNEMFDTFRVAPGNFKPEIRTVSRKIEDLTDNFDAFLTGQQKSTFDKAKEFLSQNYTLADLHDARKVINTLNKDITSKKAGPTVAEAFKGLKKELDITMESVAKKANVLQEYKNANAHFQEKLLPLINAKTDKIASALSEQGLKTNPSQAAKVMDDWVDSNLKLDKPQRTKAFLNTLDPVGRDAVEKRAIEKTLQQVQEASNVPKAFREEIKKYTFGGTDLFTGENKKLIQGVTRVLEEGKTIQDIPIVGTTTNLLGKWLESSPARGLLSLMGDPSTPKAVVREFITKGAALLGGNIGNVAAEAAKGQDNAN